jgi:hypothetical protein
MELDESAAAAARFHEAIEYARRTLEEPVRRDSPWPVLGAATLFAACALAFAFATILSPPAQLSAPSAVSTPI